MADNFIGKLIDRKYRLLSELGCGAMGVVYRAEQLDAEGRARRIVAVKTLKPEFSKDPDFARRFLREVGVVMQLRSPHALTVYDSGRDETGQLYYVMEFMPQTLKATGITQESKSVIKCWCYGQHQRGNNPCNGNVSYWLTVSQHTDKLCEFSAALRPHIARYLAPCSLS